MKVKRIIRKLLTGQEQVRAKHPLIDEPALPAISEAAAAAVASIRGQSGRPIIFIQGVMPRCGSNYIARLIGYHPHVHALPNQLNEFPLLKHADHLLRMQEQFFAAYPHNRERMGAIDFLPLFGAAVVAYLQGFGSPGEVKLLKTPYVDNLNLFFALFPHEHLIVVLRDGRDVVSSTMKTWPGKFSFDAVCRAWAANVERILAFDAFHRGTDNPYLLVKYEDVVGDPVRFITTVCRRLGLDRDCYPLDKLEDTPVIGSSTLRVDGQMTWKGIPKPDDFNPVGRWKDWTPKEKAVFIEHAGKALEQAGYCTDFHWAE